MEFRHLRYFIAVAEELHFGRAAERLHIAQPPLSQQIRQLEEELGFQLFHRTKRSVQLTEAGQAFLKEARRVLKQLEQAVQVGQLTNRGEMGQLVLGFVSSAAYNVLPTILRHFRALAPAVKLTLRELTTDQQLNRLRAGRIDIGLLRPPVEEEGLAQLILLQEPLMVALPELHPLAEQAQISLKAIANEPFILFPRHLAPGLYDQIISLCQTAHFSPNVAKEAVQMQTIVSLVAAEMGIAIVPASLQNLQRTGVVYRPMQEQTPKAAIALVWRHQDASPTVQRFLAIAQQVIQNESELQDLQGLHP
jgi:DNA-binding transcriptional LysR family regulator